MGCVSFCINNGIVLFFFYEEAFWAMDMIYVTKHLVSNGLCL